MKAGQWSKQEAANGNIETGLNNLRERIDTIIRNRENLQAI